MILHVDMDAFFASIEQAINPRLKGKPLIIGTRTNKMHTAVCAASYEAKRLGIGAGMTSAEAFKLCPNLEFVSADQGKYIWTSEQIYGMLKGYNRPLNYASIDEFQMDIQGVSNPHSLADEIRQKINAAFDITASIGIAKNWLLAKLASKINKPNGTCIITDENQNEILGKTPVEKLCGIGPKAEIRVKEIGIQTCRDLYQKLPGLWNELLGSTVFDSNDEAPKSVGHSYTLPRTTRNQDFLHAWMRLLSEMVAVRLRHKGLVSKTVHLWLNGPEMPHFGHQRTFQGATNDGFEIYQRSRIIMARVKNPGIRALGITCSSLEKARYGALFIEQKRREELTRSIDQINEKYGEHTVMPAVVCETRKMK